MKEYESQRTIEEVLDIEVGEIISSKDFFKLPESELIYFRRIQEESAIGERKPKFICPYCRQILRILGKPTQRGIVSYFAHLYDSDECEIKTSSNYTREEIEAIKYAGIKESQRHIELKDKIARALTNKKSKELGVRNVEVEARIQSENPLLNWRKPDVSAEFQGKKLVFELQLSTTFLSVIVARDIFYKLNNTYIIWVFNFSKNTEYVNMSNLMCKDIYYANKRNAFVFDAKAMEMSEKAKELILLCIWFEPSIINGKYISGKVIRHEEYIHLSDLSFDDKELKPYYVDADKMFLNFDKDLYQKRIKLENEKFEWLKRIEDGILARIQQKKLDLERKEEEKRSKLEELLNGIEEGKYVPIPMKKGGKWGYQVENKVVIPPLYNLALPFDESGYAKVRRNRRYGFIDKKGNEIVPCRYTGTYRIDNGHVIAYDEWCYEVIEIQYNSVSRFSNRTSLTPLNEYVLKYFRLGNRYGDDDYYGLCNYQGDFLTEMKYSKIQELSFSSYEEIIKFAEAGYDNHTLCLIKLNGDNQCEYILLEEKKNKNSYLHVLKEGRWGLTDIYGNEIVPCEYATTLSQFGKGFKVKHNSLIGCIDLNGNQIIPFSYEEINFLSENRVGVKKGNLYGIIDFDGNETIPCIYQSLRRFDSLKAIVNRANKWGFIDFNGNEIIPCIYENMHRFQDGRAKVEKDGHTGYIDIHGTEIIPCIYDEIDKFHGEMAEVKRDGLTGYIDKSGNEIIPCVFDKIEQFQESKARACKNGLWGYIDTNGNEIIPCQYSTIETFMHGEAKACKAGMWGIIDADGNELVKFIYQELVDTNNGFYKVKMDNKWGYIDYSGTIIVRIIYDELQDFYSGHTTIRIHGDTQHIYGLARYKISEKRGYVDKKGKEYWQYWKDDRDFIVNRRNKKW